MIADAIGVRYMRAMNALNQGQGRCRAGLRSVQDNLLWAGET